MLKKKTIRDLRLKAGSRVIVRADFNVPLDENGKVADEYRIEKTLPTLNYLAQKGCRVVLLSHLGRPEGHDETLSLRPVYDVLAKKLKAPIRFVNDSLGDEVEDEVNSVERGSFLLLENVRFNKGEDTHDEKLAKTYASYGDYFVMDAFGVAHRDHASTTGIAKYLPAAAGLLVEAEYNAITSVIKEPKQPLLTIIGGAKISDKIDVINKLMRKSDMMAIGGAMANTFLLAQGLEIGKSVAEKSEVGLARKILEAAEKKRKSNGFTFYLPQDGVVAKVIDSKAKPRVVDWGSRGYADISAYPKHPDVHDYTVAKDELILDIGPASANYIAAMTRSAATVIWNGPLGFTEIKPLMTDIGPFEHGSYTVLSALTKDHAPKGQYTLIGGGETAAFVLGRGEQSLDHISTGGGASLALMAGKKLPAIQALSRK